MERGSWTASGPLLGVRVLEVGGIGPNPFAAMLLADLGADVLRVERAGAASTFPRRYDVTRRGRTAVDIDLRSPAGRALVLDLCEDADALIEGHRPGVMERLGLGPDDVQARNPRLVYGRMTGWGQEGPLAGVAGHDINYIATAGVLGALGRPGEAPPVPLNLIGDYGGGAMFLALGVVAALLEATRSGRGQVVDAAMVDGAALLTSIFHGFRAAGQWRDERGANLLDGGAHFYEVYATSDGGHVAVGAIEAQFYARLLELLALDPATHPQWERERWPELRARFAEVFAARPRVEWERLFDGEDACACVVLGLADAPLHPHLRARETFVEVDGLLQPNVAPRFDRTPGSVRPAGRDPEAALRAWGIDPADHPAALMNGVPT